MKSFIAVALFALVAVAVANPYIGYGGSYYSSGLGYGSAIGNRVYGGYGNLGAYGAGVYGAGAYGAGAYGLNNLNGYGLGYNRVNGGVGSYYGGLGYNRAYGGLGYGIGGYGLNSYGVNGLGGYIKK